MEQEDVVSRRTYQEAKAYCRLRTSKVGSQTQRNSKGFPMRLLAAALLAIALFCSRPASAGPAERAISVLCPKSKIDPSIVEKHARKHLLHPYLLVSLIANESGCDNTKTGALGEIGYGQIFPGRSAAKGLSRSYLKTEEGNIAATARHLARCLTLCGGLTGLSIYAGHKKCMESTYSKNVLKNLKKL